MHKLVLILSVIIFFSCKKEGAKSTQVVNQDNEVENVQQTAIVLKDGSLVVSDWIELANLQEELKSVSSRKITTTKELEQIINLLAKLKETIPEKFMVEAINARIKVLETELFMFNQFVSEQDYKQASIRKIDMQKAYNLMINQFEALLIKEKDYEKYK